MLSNRYKKIFILSLILLLLLTLREKSIFLLLYCCVLFIHLLSDLLSHHRAMKASEWICMRFIFLKIYLLNEMKFLSCFHFACSFCHYPHFSLLLYLNLFVHSFFTRSGKLKVKYNKYQDFFKKLIFKLLIQYFEFSNS